MHISWTFLDKHRAAVAALEARNSMLFIIEHTPDDVQNVRDNMSTYSSPVYSHTPHTHNPKSGESRLLAGIDTIDAMEERYNQAVEYFDWFAPAWNQLSEGDQYVLETFFLTSSSDPVGDVSEYFGIERSSAYSKRKRAVDRLSTLLYGK